MAKSKQKFYVVKKGHIPGIYSNWEECKKQITGFSGAIYKSFPSLSEAEAFYQNQASEKAKHISDPNVDLSGVVAYVDGSSNFDYRVAGYGIVFVKDGKHLIDFNRAYRFPENDTSTNVGAELRGAYEAVRIALMSGYTQLTIAHDYSGIAHFALGEWTPSDSVSIQYTTFIKEAMELIDLTFVKLPAHQGHQWNERADQLANIAVKHYIGDNFIELIKKFPSPQQI